MIKVLKLHPDAKLPECAHPGEDLAFDLFSVENVTLFPGRVVRIRTGVAIQFPAGIGGLIRDRSSMAGKGITTSGGVFDNGYRGECMVMLTLEAGSKLVSHSHLGYDIHVGDKIAQIIPIQVRTNHYPVVEVEQLDESTRGVSGFGSTGR